MRSPLHSGRYALAACGLLLGSIALGPAAHGQERLILDEDDQWESAEVVDPTSSAGQLAEIRRAIVDGRSRQAVAMATEWIDANPGDQLLPHAYLLRADAYVAGGDFYKSLYDLETISTVYPNSDVFVLGLERTYDVAAHFASGAKRRVLGVRLVRAEDEAEELLIRIQERLPGSRLAERAGMTLSDFYFDRRNMALAAESYQLFIENYPRSEMISKARRRLIYSYLAAFKGPRFDPSGLYEARVQLRRLKRLEPATAQRIGADALLAAIDESDAEQLLEMARWYIQTTDYAGAEMVIRRLVQQYPRTSAAGDGLRLVETILPKLPPAVLAEAPNYRALSVVDRSASTTVDELDEEESP